MAEPEFKSLDDLRRLAKGHLESLRAAGVEWLPAAPGGASAMEMLTRLTEAPIPAEPQSIATARKQSVPPDELFAKVENAASRGDAPIEQRRQELAVIADRVKACTRCPELASTRTQTVFGVGAIKPELCFVGEAPGADEDRQGEPFVGPAGQLLNKIIGACGLRREEVYICNIIKCRPPGNRTPLPHEAAHCREYLETQLELIEPRYICALGACAAQNLLGTTVSIGRLRGQFQKYKNIPVLCTYHPAYLLRSPDKKRDVWADMQLLMREMGRTIPPTKGP
jgi:DNA polymerase